MKFLEIPNTQLTRKLLGAVEMNHQICLYESVSCLLLSQAVCQLFPHPGKSRSCLITPGCSTVQSSANRTLSLTPPPDQETALGTDPWLCHCEGCHQGGSQSETQLNCSHIKLSFCSTAANTWCRKPHHKGAEETRPAGQPNVPNTLHLLLYASLLPHQAPQALLPNPRSTSGAKAGARQGGSLSTRITLQSLEAVPSDATNSATGLKEHVP